MSSNQRSSLTKLSVKEQRRELKTKERISFVDETSVCDTCLNRGQDTTSAREVKVGAWSCGTLQMALS